MKTKTNATETTKSNAMTTEKKATKKGTLASVKQNVKNQLAEVATQEKENKEITEQVKQTETVVPAASAEQRLRNLKNFNLLHERYNWLLKKQDELTAFQISNDGTKERIVLENQNGFKFEVTNTQIIQEVFELLTKHIDTKIENTQTEIINYSI